MDVIQTAVLGMLASASFDDRCQTRPRRGRLRRWPTPRRPALASVDRAREHLVQHTTRDYHGSPPIGPPPPRRYAIICRLACGIFRGGARACGLLVRPRRSQGVFASCAVAGSIASREDSAWKPVPAPWAPTSVTLTGQLSPDVGSDSDRPVQAQVGERSVDNLSARPGLAGSTPAELAGSAFSVGHPLQLLFSLREELAALVVGDHAGPSAPGNGSALEISQKGHREVDTQLTSRRACLATMARSPSYVTDRLALDHRRVRVAARSGAGRSRRMPPAFNAT